MTSSSALGRVSCHGKGRKQRITPLTTVTVAVLRSWLAERHGNPGQPLLPNRTGGRLSRDAVEKRLALHVTAAASKCKSLKAKNVTAHTLRHTAARRLLHAGVDTSVIALWLGHEKAGTTQIYLHADLDLKEKPLARTAPANTAPRALQAPGPAPSLPRKPLIMPTFRPAIRPPPAIPAARPA